jgi:ADP-heptose:LPS heptosyltransferase
MMRILVLHAGGLGDLVLAETLFAALRERYPDGRLELACRTEVASVASLYARPPDAVHPFPFNPYRWALPSGLVVAEIQALAGLVGEGVDLLISAELRGTWLGETLAALLAPREAILPAPPGGRATYDLAVLLRRLGAPRHADAQRVRAVNGEHELDRYARLTGEGRRLPALRPSPRAAADPWLAVFPAGSPALKLWPHERMADAATQIASRMPARIVLVGSTAERGALAAAARAFPTPPEILTADVEGLPGLAARLAGAQGYLGIDSGLAHLAAAYGVPGVSIHSGATWPAYAPWRAGSAAVVAPIPCYGCELDCAFDRAFCIDGIDVASVVAAFLRARDAASAAPFVVEVDAYSERERSIFAGAGRVHRATQADRAARLVSITRVRDLLRRYAVRAGARQHGSAVRLARLASAAEQAAALLARSKGGTRE